MKRIELFCILLLGTTIGSLFVTLPYCLSTYYADPVRYAAEFGPWYMNSRLMVPLVLFIVALGGFITLRAKRK